MINSNNPSISVLVPIYNAERYLRKALDSILAQTFQDFEVICINDGSTDRSRDIIQSYLAKDSRFRIIDKPNSGYGASMNLGMQEAKGDYVAILEPDDFLEPDAYKKLYTKAIEHNVDIVKGNYWFYWSKPKEKNQLISVIKSSMANKVIDPQKEPEIYLALPSIWSAIYKRSYLIENKISFLETPGASFQDLSFTFKIWAFTHRIFLLEDPLLHYRQDNESSSVNDPDKAFCIVKELDEIERTSESMPNKTELQPYVYRIKYDNYMWNYQRLTPEIRSIFLEEMVRELKNGQLKGHYNANIFGSWQNKNLQFLLNDPQKFLQSFPINPNRFEKAKYYFKLGGVRLLIDALRR